jgi:hypothetical protein
MTPQLAEEAERLYADGYSLGVIGKQLGFGEFMIPQLLLTHQRDG